MDLADCGTWDPAYRTSDGKTVRPVPECEREYKKFARELSRNFGEDELTIEGLD
jgi:hypothetical protein